MIERLLQAVHSTGQYNTFVEHCGRCSVPQSFPRTLNQLSRNIKRLSALSYAVPQRGLRHGYPPPFRSTARSPYKEHLMGKNPSEQPQVWTPPPSLGGKFGSVNRPTAGAQSTQELPRGDKPLQLYSMETPNGVKVAILLEELAALGIDGAAYDAHRIDIMQGEQFGSGFVAINPNSKIPALVDQSEKPALPIFESGAILLYLAEKFGHFLPAGPQRAQCLSWLFWQMGSAPYLGGGFGHFYVYAPEKIQYAIDRFTMETKRQLSVLDNQLRDNEYICGSDYTVADMAIWPWYGCVALGGVYNAAEFLDAQAYPHLLRWAHQVDARPAVRSGRALFN